MPFECNSQRLLNPFRGVVNCIRYRSAEAVSAKGVKWDIYVSNDGLLNGLPRRHGTDFPALRRRRGDRPRRHQYSMPNSKPGALPDNCFRYSCRIPNIAMRATGD
jgi:hypothetical protein